MNKFLAFISRIVICSSAELDISFLVCGSIKAVAYRRAFALKELAPCLSVILGNKSGNRRNAYIILCLYGDSDKMTEDLPALRKEESYFRNSLVTLCGSGLLIGIDTFLTELIYSAHHVEVDVAFSKVLIDILESFSLVYVLEKLICSFLGSAVKIISYDLCLSRNTPGELHFLLAFEYIETENLFRRCCINSYF